MDIETKTTSPPDINAPVAFDRRWRASSHRFRSCARHLRETLMAVEQRQRRRSIAADKRFTQSVEVLLCNFACLQLASLGATLQVPTKTHTAGRGMVHALVRMHQLGLLVLERDKRAFAGHKPRRYSVASATALLAAYFPPELSWRDLQLSRGRGSSLLKLRGKKWTDGQADEKRWRHNSETESMSSYMRTANQYLASLPITVDGSKTWTLPDRDGLFRHFYTPQHSRCKRIFNNGTFENGGRLYGGWWLPMSKKERVARIQLAGEIVIHCDFKAIYPRLAYSHVGAQWPFGDNDDPYKALPTGTREAWKSCFSAMLSSSKPLKHLPLAVRSGFQGMPARAVYDAICNMHRPLTVGNAFFSGLGLLLSRRESDLMVALLLKLSILKIPALPIHDCLLVPVSKASIVAGVMQATARKLLRCELPVNIGNSDQNDIEPGSIVVHQSRPPGAVT